jgi:hypothetical protein
VTKALDDERAGKLTTKQFIGTVSPLIDEADEVDAQMKAHKVSLQWAGGHALDDGSGDPPERSGGPGGFCARGIDNGKRLVFGTKSANALATKMLGDGQLGSKALAPSGSAVVAQEFRPDPIALGKPAHSLLDVLPVIAHDSAEFSYMRQT